MRDLLRPESDCPGFALRRLHVGELAGEEAERVRSHLSGCARCARTWEALEREREALPPIEAFRAGVERKQRPRPSTARRWVPLALAAGVTFVAAIPLLRSEPPPTASERTKGAVGVEFLVGGRGAVRVAAEGERLAPGESVRLRLVPGPHRYAIAFSVSEDGEVSTLYDAHGASLRVAPYEAQLLPDAIAFDGTDAERIYVFLTDEPLDASAIAAALAEARRAAGSVRAMQALPGVPGTQSNLLVIPAR